MALNASESQIKRRLQNRHLFHYLFIHIQADTVGNHTTLAEPEKQDD